MTLAPCQYPIIRIPSQASNLSFLQRGMATVQRILSFITWLTAYGLRSLNDRFVAWKQALLIVQPETLLRGPRLGFKLYWKYKSRAKSATPRISAETVALRKRDGQGQSPVGSRTHPWRTP